MRVDPPRVPERDDPAPGGPPGSLLPRLEIPAATVLLVGTRFEHVRAIHS
ncbi:MAG: hypothetical protein ACT4PV_06650 [Planctomycetaceae bacterium]